MRRVTSNAAVQVPAARSEGGFSAMVERRLTFVVAAGASVVSVAASVPNALHYTFWADEYASARVIREQTISLALGRIARRESTPPAWYLLAWTVHHAAGVTPHSLRMLSVIFSAALAGLSVVYARRFVSLFGAALVGLLVALGGEFMRHNWELRSYAALALLCLVFAMTLEWACRSASRGRLAALAIVVALGSTTHYFFLFTLLAGLAWLWLTPSAAGVRLRITGATALGLIPLLAWGPWFVHQTTADHTRHLGGFAVSKLARAEPRIMATGYSGLLALNVAIDVLVVVGAILLFRRGGRSALCALLAVSPLACAAVLSLVGFDLLDFRNLIGGGPFLAVAGVVAIEAIPVRALARIAVAAAFVLAIYGFVVARPGPPRHRPAGSARAAVQVPHRGAGSAEAGWFPLRTG
jgi:hypothetical protein